MDLNLQVKQNKILYVTSLILKIIFDKVSFNTEITVKKLMKQSEIRFLLLLKFLRRIYPIFIFEEIRAKLAILIS